MRRLRPRLALGLLAGWLTLAHAGFSGPVIKVHDGDTLTVLVERQPMRVRLDAIDAPELGQAFGRRAKESLHELCGGKLATVMERGRDRYRRIVARVRCGGIEANREQVSRGMAWVFDRYAAGDRTLNSLQVQARLGRRGLWTEAAPVAPWDYRASRRAIRRAASARPSAQRRQP